MLTVPRVSQLSPVVTVKQCFDELLIPDDHVSRRPTDTFFVDGEHVLRTHVRSSRSAGTFAANVLNRLLDRRLRIRPT